MGGGGKSTRLSFVFLLPNLLIIIGCYTYGPVRNKSLARVLFGLACAHNTNTGILLLCGPVLSGPVLHAKCLITGKSSYEGMYLTYQIIPSTVLQYYPYRNGTATHACLAWCAYTVAHLQW